MTVQFGSEFADGHPKRDEDPHPAFPKIVVGKQRRPGMTANEVNEKKLEGDGHRHPEQANENGIPAADRRETDERTPG